MTIRPARLGDVAAVVEIDEEAFTHDRLTPRKLRRLLRGGNCALLVAVLGSEVAGYALLLFRRGASRARLYGFAVRASRRRRGLGRRLLAAAESEARRRRSKSIGLEASPDGEAAIKLYRKRGYVLVERLGPYYEDGSHADRYVKALR